MDLKDILFASFYLSGIVIVMLRYTSWLEDRNLQWLVYVLAVGIFPAVICL